MTKIFFCPSYSKFNHCYCECNKCSNIKISKCLVSNETLMSNFHPLEIVGRDSETQLQVGENLIRKPWRGKNYNITLFKLCLAASTCMQHRVGKTVQSNDEVFGAR